MYLSASLQPRPLTSSPFRFPFDQDVYAADFGRAVQRAGFSSVAGASAVKNELDDAVDYSNLSTNFHTIWLLTASGTLAHSSAPGSITPGPLTHPPTTTHLVPPLPRPTCGEAEMEEEH